MLLENGTASAGFSEGGILKHVFSVVGVALAALFVVVFFTGRIDSKHLVSVAPRVGMRPDALDAMAPRISSKTGATIGTSKRVVYLLACSGVPTASTMENQATQAADITEKRGMTAREATVFVLSGSHRDAEHTLLKDC